MNLPTFEEHIYSQLCQMLADLEDPDNSGKKLLAHIDWYYQQPEYRLKAEIDRKEGRISQPIDGFGLPAVFLHLEEITNWEEVGDGSQIGEARLTLHLVENLFGPSNSRRQADGSSKVNRVYRVARELHRVLQRFTPKPPVLGDLTSLTATGTAGHFHRESSETDTLGRYYYIHRQTYVFTVFDYSTLDQGNLSQPAYHFPHTQPTPSPPDDKD